MRVRCARVRAHVAVFVFCRSYYGNVIHTPPKNKIKNAVMAAKSLPWSTCTHARVEQCKNNRSSKKREEKQKELKWQLQMTQSLVYTDFGGVFHRARALITEEQHMVASCMFGKGWLQKSLRELELIYPQASRSVCRQDFQYNSQVGSKMPQRKRPSRQPQCTNSDQRQSWIVERCLLFRHAQHL